MRTRSKARQRAVEALFEAEQRGTTVSEVFERNPAVNEYAVVAATQVWDHLSRIDEILSTYAKDWPVDRMPAVDRAILRLAVSELVFNQEIDSAVVIAEAVEIAKTLSSDESVKFINGLLSNIAAVRKTLHGW